MFVCILARNKQLLLFKKNNYRAFRHGRLSREMGTGPPKIWRGEDTDTNAPKFLLVMYVCVYVIVIL